jgi:N-acetylglucosamine-6-phosphate deacetylase
MMPGDKAFGSNVEGMDLMVRTFFAATSRPLHEVIKMASLTLAHIAGGEKEIGSLAAGKRADIVVLSKDLQVQRGFKDGVDRYLAN